MSTITVYSKPSCVQCTATYRALNRQGVEYAVIDVTTDAEALAYVKDTLGILQAPVVVIRDAEGEVLEAWGGFQPDRCNNVAAAVPVPLAA